MAIIPLVATLFAASAVEAGSNTGPEASVLASTDNVVITQDGDWMRYAYSERLEDPQKFSYRGTPDGTGGCTFSGEDEAGSDDQAPGIVVYEREIATNLKTCIMQVERAEVASGGEPGPGAARDDGAPDVIDEDSGFTLAATSRSAWHRTSYKDPPGYLVNWSRATVLWSYSGGCVTSGSGYAQYDWIWQTGWWKSSSSVTTDKNCTRYRVTSNSKFSNTVFCNPAVLTTTEYVPNSIRGRADGTYRMVWTAKKSGDCSYLLSFHRTHGYN
ncbi:hypothetical protein [Microbacterium sp.]|uniref:hypothetical protein n=1 Tax=Microbacterium sp. TaxID=51671 RepID=UPI0027343CF7|nr:hypothetical protein [Microbacterium sp.]MDP3950310.1 hypothetical protein [Microbacterium sp.]